MKKAYVAPALVAGILSLGITAATTPAAHAAADPQSCQVVRMADIGWTDNAVQNAVFSNLLTALGYTPKATLYAEEVTYAGLQNSQLDVFLDDWTPSMDAISGPYEKAGSIDVIGPDLVGAKYTLVVPTYLYNEGLKSFADIKKFGPQLNYNIYGIEPGNDGNVHILKMIQQNMFGLSNFHLVQSSEAGMLSEVSRLYPQKKAVVFLGWEPEPMNVTYSLKYLSGGDALFGPDEGAAKIYINTRHGYAQQCPNVGAMLKSFSLPIEAENAMMYDIQIKNENADAVAKSWLKANPAWVQTQLTNVVTTTGQPGLAAVNAALAN
jgi:glycine betaine/proline transport system substrate-binding protein